MDAIKHTPEEDRDHYKRIFLNTMREATKVKVQRDDVIRVLEYTEKSYAELKAERGEAIQLLKHALADLEGVMEQMEPDGQRQHPGWKTIGEISTFLAKMSK